MKAVINSNLKARKEYTCSLKMNNGRRRSTSHVSSQGVYYFLNKEINRGMKGYWGITSHYGLRESGLTSSSFLGVVGRGSGLVGRGGLVLGLSLVGGLVLGVLSLALILDISDVARVAILDSVGDDLGPAVGKGNTVLAVGGIAIPSLILAEVGARVVILNTVLVGVGGRLVIGGLLVGRGGLVGGSRGVGRGRGIGESTGNSHEGGDGNEGLKI